MAFTERQIEQPFVFPDGTLPGPDSYLTFVLTVPLLDTDTGIELVPKEIRGYCDATGLLTVTLDATDDPTTQPTGAGYRVTHVIRNQVTPLSYSVAIPSAGVGVLLLSDLAPADVAPAITYGLSSLLATLPMHADFSAGTYTIWLDATGLASGADLAAELAARLLVEAALGAGLTGLVNQQVILSNQVGINEAAILSEAGTARTAESALGGRVEDLETSDAQQTSDIGGLETGADTEATTRAAGDVTQAGLTATETTRATAAEEVNAGAISTHGALTTTAHGGIIADTDARLTNTRTPTAHAASHITGGSDIIANVVAGGAAGLLTGADKTKLDGIAAGAQVGTVTSIALTMPADFSVGGTPITGAGTLAVTRTTQTANTVQAGPGSGAAATPSYRALVAADVPDLSAVYLPVARLTGGGVLATAGYTLTLPATGTAALVERDNVFSVAQGVRVAAAGVAAGLYAPYVASDALPAIVGGGSTTGNAQAGVSGLSDSGAGVQGTSNTGPAVLGILTGPGFGGVEARYTGSNVGQQQLMTLRNNTTGTVVAGTGVQFNIYGKSATVADRLIGQLTAVWGVATDAVRTGLVRITAGDSGGARVGLAVGSSGSAPMLGFFGATAAIRPTVTGTQNGNPALASMLTGLAGLGLLTDSSTTGTAPIVVLAPHKVGDYLAPPCITGTLSRTNGNLYLSPLVLTQAQTLDALVVQIVTTPGSAGAVTRMGIYASAANGRPGALILDAGTAVATSTGILSITINQALAAGVYWLAAVTQGAPTTPPTYTTNGGALPYVDSESTAQGLAGGLNGWQQTSVTGALPDPAVVTNSTFSSIRVIARVSA